MQHQRTAPRRSDAGGPLDHQAGGVVDGAGVFGVITPCPSDCFPMIMVRRRRPDDLAGQLFTSCAHQIARFIGVCAHRRREKCGRRLTARQQEGFRRGIASPTAGNSMTIKDPRPGAGTAVISGADAPAGTCASGLRLSWLVQSRHSCVVVGPTTTYPLAASRVPGLGVLCLSGQFAMITKAGILVWHPI